jgi:transposase-like protein
MNIIEVFRKFPAQEDCISYLEKVRWNGVPKCPYCGSDNSTPLAKEQRHHCNNCNTSYSVTVNTIFHQTHLPLQKWFLAISLILNAKKGIAARQLARDIQVHRNTAWRISMKIREAMSQKHQRELLTGMIEMDETFIGPRKPRKQYPGQRFMDGSGHKKQPVVGMVERDGDVVAKMVAKRSLKSKKLNTLIRDTVDIKNAILITDQYKGYCHVSGFMEHRTVNHSVWYVEDDGTHTNTIESFWALLKRGIVGQFHKVSLLYLPRYIDEFTFRFNHRKTPDLFGLTVKRGLGVA